MSGSYTLPWLTSSIMRNIKKRNCVFRKFQRTKSVHTWSEYKSLRNKVISLIRLNKRKYIESLNPSTKLFWKFVKGLKKNGNSIPKLYSSEGTLYSTNIKKADALNSYFSSCFNASVNPLCDSDFTDRGASNDLS